MSRLSAKSNDEKQKSSLLPENFDQGKAEVCTQQHSALLGHCTSVLKGGQGLETACPKPYGPSTWQEMSQGKALHFNRGTAENGKVVGGLGPE
jgi:hypothetical protein